MKLSNQLLEAVTGSDAAKSLNSLIKYSKGEWKSEKQAKYLLRDLKDNYQTKGAVLWAMHKGLYGKGVVAIQLVTRIRGYGQIDPSKVRYLAQVFILDGSGVIARAKFKYKHYKKATEKAGGIDWASGKITFQRKEKPSKAYVDLEKEEEEERKRIEADREKSKQQAALIKTIPDWEDKNILVDFMGQLVKGHPLSLNQMAVVQNMLPEKNILIGNKKEWIRAYSSLKKLVVEKLAKEWKDIDIYSTKRQAEEYEAASEVERWSMSKPMTPEESAKRFDNFISKLQSGTTDVGEWPDSWIFNLLSDVVYGVGSKRQTIYRDADGFGDIEKYYNKAIKAKRPSKVSLRVITYIIKAEEKLRSISVDRIRKLIAKTHGYPLPKSSKKQSDELKKAIGGYSVPSPAKFGF